MKGFLQIVLCAALLLVGWLPAGAQETRDTEIQALDREFQTLLINSECEAIIRNRSRYLTLVPEGSHDWFSAIFSLTSYYFIAGIVAPEGGKVFLDRAETVFGALPAPDALQKGMMAAIRANYGMYKKDYRLTFQELMAAYRLVPEFPAERGIDKSAVTLNLAAIFQALGKYKESLQLFEQAAAFLSSIATTESVLSQAEIYCNQGVSYRKLGDIRAALSCYEKSEALFRQAGSSHHFFLPVLYGNLQTLYGTIGDPVKARHYADKSLSLAKTIYGRDSYNYAMVLAGTAMVDESDIECFYSRLQEAVGILEVQGLTNNLMYCTALDNMATCEQRRGRYKAAAELHAQVVQLWKTSSSPDPYYLGLSLGNLGVDYYNLGEKGKARAAFREAIDLLKEGIGTDSEAYMLQVVNLCETADTLQERLALLLEALGALDSSNPAMVKSHLFLLKNIAVQYGNMGDTATAEKYLSEALQLAEQIQGDNQIVEILCNQGEIYLRAGQVEQYGEANLRAREILDRTGQRDKFYFRVMSSLADYHRRFSGKKEALEEVLLSMMQAMRDAARENLSYMTEKQRENFWENFQFGLTMVFQNAGEFPEIAYDAALMAKGLLLSSSIELEKIIFESGDATLSDKLAQLKKMRAELTESPSRERAAHADSLENVIASSCKEYGALLSCLSCRWQDVQAALGEGDIAVELLSYDDNGTPIYSGIALMKGWDKPRIMFSGYSEKKDYALIWAETARQVGKGANIWFAPDGDLHTEPLEYLPTNKKGRRMCDLYRMHRVASTRDLVSGLSSSKPQSAAVFGGFDYYLSGDEMELAGEALVRSASSDRQEWAYLPWTLTEAQRVARTLSDAGLSVEVKTGAAGVESAFKQLSGTAPSIIHIATHGMASGLVFAGANSGYTSGILTADEITHMDLRGTSLVVLSACSTGLGKATHEGVFGLQRAFKKAGAQSIVMTLWDIEDEVTEYMMEAFYRGLTSGSDVESAFSGAITATRKKYPDPRRWSAFILLL
jgi:tetratricopeptide (TPR) repeat protein